MGASLSGIDFSVLDLSALSTFSPDALFDPTNFPVEEEPTVVPTTQPTPRPTVPLSNDIMDVQINCDSIDEDRFNICLDLRVAESTIPFFKEAAAIWESVNIGDKPDDAVGYLFEPGVAAQNPDLFLNLRPTVIDDLYISAVEEDIDGPGGTLGFAGPSFSLNGIPILGQMVFDKADFEQLRENRPDLLIDTITHEMGHVQGIGTLWQSQGIFDRRSGIYSGQNANRVWTEACGGTSVPVQVTRLDGRPISDFGQDGSVYGHWDEACLGVELMSPQLSPRRQNPLSAITVASLADLGWEVDLDKAEPFTPNPTSECRVECRPPNRRKLRVENSSRRTDGGQDTEGLEKFSGTDGNLTEDVRPKLSPEKLENAAKSAFLAMKRAREARPQGIPESWDYVACEATTVLFFDDEDNVRDLSFHWSEVKDMF